MTRAEDRRHQNCDQKEGPLQSNGPASTSTEINEADARPHTARRLMRHVIL
jgi:hypothetical protein